MPNSSIIVRTNLLKNIDKCRAAVEKLNNFVNGGTCSDAAFKLLSGTIDDTMQKRIDAEALLIKFDAGRFTRKHLLLAANESYKNIL